MDSREVGMRVGAATNQAVSVVAAAIETGQFPVDADTIAVFAEDLAGKLVGVMDRITSKVNGTPVAVAPAQVQAAFPGSQFVNQSAVPVAQVAAPAPQQTASPSGYNTQFSGSTRPLKLAEHPELDGWLHAQAAAVGVYEVWDNRNKPDYIAAIQSGSAKTPPPFRSATKGVDKSFWPPK